MPRKPLSISFDTPLDTTTYKGINIPWLQFATGAEAKHDGYGNAFADSYFNGTGANADIQKQLDLIKSCGIVYLRLWLNIWHYMNADKATAGYTSFNNNFLINLATFCDWCNDRGLKLLICLDDCWYTFPWLWVIDTPKRNSYIQACVDVVTALKDKSAVWGWDYCNEPYMGWAWDDVNSTLHRNQGTETVDIGYTRATLTDFFIELYNTLKPIVPTHYFSVGSTTPPNQHSKDLSRWNIKDAVDFYQVHWYGTNISSFTYYANEFDKPVIVGEYGWNGGGSNATNAEFNKAVLMKFIQNGFGLHMLWAWNQVRFRNGSLDYALTGFVKDMKP